ncbi:MAG TPA: hypothetical protein VGS22_26190 [Thermoanaerobaculia bacterium]|jgi:hypothetical protein|nr:hypothetical protein [Thermoanaerobaculia bacterium]
MKIEVTRVRLFLDLDVVRGRRWRDLAPFREAVLFNFTPPALREQVVALCEAVADQILEEVTADLGYGEPRSRAQLRAILLDLQHGKFALRENVETMADEIDRPDDREIRRRSIRLAKHLERELAGLESLIGPPPLAK